MNGEVASTVPSPGAFPPPGEGGARGLPARAFGETMRATFGGLNRCLFLSVSRSLSFIQPGRHFRGPIIFLATTFHHFIRRRFLVIRRSRGSDRNRAGGRNGCFFRRRF